MSDSMTFPDTVEEFMNFYKVVDSEGIYMSKGAELVPIFRMMQWFEHMPSEQPERKTGKWINGHWDGDSNFRIDGRGNCWYVRECSNCHEEIEGKPTKYCPNCGARMLKEGEEHETD